MRRFFWPPLWVGSALSVALCCLSVLPFVLKAWYKDRTVVVISPALLPVRALALGSGFVLGMWAAVERRRGVSQVRPL